MASVRISTVGQERREVNFEPGETLGEVFQRTAVEIPAGAGIEVWINGEAVRDWPNYGLEDGDAVVLMPNLKGASVLS